MFNVLFGFRVSVVLMTFLGHVPLLTGRWGWLALGTAEMIGFGPFRLQIGIVSQQR